MRRLLAIFLVASFVAVLQVAGPPALAACPAEHTLFVQMGPSTRTGDGQAQDLYIRNRGLSSVSGCLDEAHSTTFIENTGQTKMAEVGWVERWADEGAGTKQWDIFIEGNDGSGYVGGFDTGVSKSSSKINQFDRFKINNPAGTTVWQFYWDEGSNGNYQLLNGCGLCDIIWDLGFDHGYPEGETGTRGGATGASDNHANMVYKSCSGGTCTWPAWPNNLNPKNAGNVGYDDIDGYEWNFVADDHYQIVACNSPC